MSRLRPFEHWGAWVWIPLEAGISVCAFILCVGSAALRRADPPSKESCQMYIGLRNWKTSQGPKGCRAIEREREREKGRESCSSSHCPSARCVSVANAVCKSANIFWNSGLNMKKSKWDGRAIAQAVNRWLPTAAARVQIRVQSCGICGGQSDAGATSASLPIFIPPISSQSPSLSPGAGTIGQ
jgi:hypothetical protein